MNQNKVFITGNIVKDAYVTQKMAKIIVAVNGYTSEKGDQSVDYIDCVGFGKIKDLLSTIAPKTKVGVEGRLSVENVKTEDGTYKTYANVIIEKIEFHSKKETV